MARDEHVDQIRALACHGIRREEDLEVRALGEQGLEQVLLLPVKLLLSKPRGYS